MRLKWRNSVSNSLLRQFVNDCIVHTHTDIHLRCLVLKCYLIAPTDDATTVDFAPQWCRRCWCLFLLFLCTSWFFFHSNFILNSNYILQVQWFCCCFFRVFWFFIYFFFLFLGFSTIVYLCYCCSCCTIFCQNWSRTTVRFYCQLNRTNSKLDALYWF